MIGKSSGMGKTKEAVRKGPLLFKYVANYYLN